MVNPALHSDGLYMSLHIIQYCMPGQRGKFVTVIQHVKTATHLNETFTHLVMTIKTMRRSLALYNNHNLCIVQCDTLDLHKVHYFTPIMHADEDIKSSERTD